MRATMTRRVWVLPLLGALPAVVGCLDILGFKDPVLDDCAPAGCTGGGGNTATWGGGAGGVGGTGGETTTSGMTGGGGQGGCSTPTDCPGTDTDCQARTCNNGTCGVAHAQAGAPCDDDGGRFCGAEGQCLECITGIECLSGLCDVGKCVTQLVWQRSWGDPEGQFGASVAADPQGNLVAAGSFFGGLPFTATPLVSAGADDVFVVKVSGTGDHVWSKSFGSSEAGQAATGIATDGNGNVLVGGTFAGSISFGGAPLQAAGASDVFVAKLGPDGAHLWSYSYGGTEFDKAHGLAVDKDGHVTVVGGFRNEIQFGGLPLTSAGADDIFVVKLNSFGSHVWSRRFGDSDYQRGKAVAVDSNKDIFLAADVWGSIDFGGGAIPTVGGEDVALVKLDTGGNYAWVRLLTSDEPVSSAALAVDPSGDVFLAGTLDGALTLDATATVAAQGGTDVFVAKFAADGTYLWGKAFGGSGQDTAGAIVTDPNGNLIVVGSFSGDFVMGSFSITGSKDAFVAKLDGATGKALYLERFSGDGTQAATSVAAVGFDVFLTGSFEGTTDFGKGPVASKGQDDLFVARVTLP